MKPRLLLTLAPLALLLAACDGYLLDNAPGPMRTYIAIPAADLATCGTITLALKDSTSLPPFNLSSTKDAFHLSTQADGYRNTLLTDAEVVERSPTSAGARRLTRPGTYVFSTTSLYRYSWAFDLRCEGTGMVTPVVRSGAFKLVNRLALLRLSVASSGQVGVTLSEHPDPSTPAELGLP